MKEDIYKKFYEAEADFKEFLPEKDVEVNARVRLVYKLLPKKGVKSILDVGVTAVEVLEHIPELDEAVKELKRVSRKYILITVPYKERPTPVYCPYCSKVFYKNGHLHYFDEEILSLIHI